ncbi:beta-lactamase/transpeptidase-like protein [Phyllosticta paracitricarpa]
MKSCRVCCLSSSSTLCRRVQSAISFSCLPPAERVVDMARQCAFPSACVLLALLVPFRLIPAASCLCIPDVPGALLHDKEVLRHPLVTGAFEELKKNLTGLFTKDSYDGLAFAVVHASGSDAAFTFNRGPLKLNESKPEDGGGPQIDGDSVFRIVSASKNLAAFSALVVERQSRSQTNIPVLTLDTPVRIALPEFDLPPTDWANGGSEITLSMLGTHSSGLPREGYATNFDFVTGLSKANAQTIGNEWASADPSEVLESIKGKPLLFAPGQRVAYSNAGTCILGYAVAAYRNRLSSSNLVWNDVVTEDIFKPLNMTHSFFGPIPDDLRRLVCVPAGETWTDLQVGPGYDPAGGGWSSANDLVKYLYNVWLKPEPDLITPTQRRNSLQPRLILPDGKQQVGFGWEINIYKPDENSSTYNAYGKSGDGGGYHSRIEVQPNLGYGVVILTAEGSRPRKDYTRLRPERILNDVHNILIQAFRKAYSEKLKEKYAGDWVVAPNTPGTANAKVELQNDILFLRELVVNNASALERVDQLSWTADSQERFFSTPDGVSLNPSEAVLGPKGEARGQVMRMSIASERCDWFDFDGYTDPNGWPPDKLFFVDGDNGVELHYPPLDGVLVRKK